MARSYSKICARLAELEAEITPEPIPPSIFTWHGIDRHRRENLAPDERIVLDCFRQRGQLIDAQERITTDPKDNGRECEPEGYLEDVIQEIHADCWLRDRGGSCMICEDTTVAGTLIDIGWVVLKLPLEQFAREPVATHNFESDF